MSASRKGLLFDDPGAPFTPHFIPGISGYYRRDIPTPVGGDGELDLDTAKELDKDKSIPLKLVDIKAGDVAQAEKVAKQTLEEVRNTRRPGAAGAEVALQRDELDSQKGA